MVFVISVTATDAKDTMAAPRLHVLYLELARIRRYCARRNYCLLALFLLHLNCISFHRLC